VTFEHTTPVHNNSMIVLQRWSDGLKDRVLDCVDLAQFGIGQTDGVIKFESFKETRKFFNLVRSL
jgi:hypothetical protein